MSPERSYLVSKPQIILTGKEDILISSQSDSVGKHKKMMLMCAEGFGIQGFISF